MKKTIKNLFKLITAIATVAGILYVARDQIKAIIAKIKEVSDDDFDDDFDDESFDDDEIFPEPSKDDRDYDSINITDADEDPSVAEKETQETETPSEESDEKE
ncbi:MAG: DNA-directed RNA polymerase subunit delta [Anaerostipes hadrus]|nr:DNA-directed RNA polymerase subunit delta [Anaerostipes hadrus]